MKKGILIDMGDTIVYNLNMDFKRGLNSLYDELNIVNVDRCDFVEYSMKLLSDIFNERKFIEFKMIDYIRFILEYYNINTDYLIEELEEIFAFNCCETKFIDGVLDFLFYLKEKKYPIILLSNTSFSKTVIKKMLGEMYKIFDDIIVSSDYPFRKPNHYIFDLGIAKLNMDKKGIYYIGNSMYYDVYGSNEAGINSIWFNEKEGKKVDLGNFKYIEIKTYKQLIDMNF